MEMVFRKIEYWIEGDRNKQMKLDRQEWDAEKIRKRLTNGLFSFDFLVISTFMFMYIVGYEQVFQIMIEGPSEHPLKFITMIFFTMTFYFVLHGFVSRYVLWFVLTEDFREF
jgi:polyferredoxin